MFLKQPLPPATDTQKRDAGTAAFGVAALALSGIGILAAVLTGNGQKKQQQTPLRGARRGCGCGR